MPFKNLFLFILSHQFLGAREKADILKYLRLAVIRNAL